MTEPFSVNLPETGMYAGNHRLALKAEPGAGHSGCFQRTSKVFNVPQVCFKTFSMYSQGVSRCLQCTLNVLNVRSTYSNVHSTTNFTLKYIKL